MNYEKTHSIITVAALATYGLPSGTMWGTTNVGAMYPENYGAYFAWGEDTNKNTFTWKNYLLCNGSSTSVDDLKGVYDEVWGISLTQYDAANYYWGDNWQIPTIYQIKELQYYCKSATTTINGVKGVRFTGPNGNSIFMPFAGYKYDSKYLGVGKEAFYWSSNYDENQYAKAQTLYISNQDISTDIRCWRRTGIPIRPVRVSSVSFVDLGLSKQWATCNIGAFSPEQRGRFYAWGETTPKTKFTWANYEWANGTANSVEDITDDDEWPISGDFFYDPSCYINKLFFDDDDQYELDIMMDPEIFYSSFCLEPRPGFSGWVQQMPTRSDIEELILRCQWKETTMNGVKGYKVTGPNGNSIFMPFSGCSYDGKEVGKDTYAYYWSGTIDPSNNQKAKALYIKSGMKEIKSAQRRTGIMIRPVRIWTSGSISPPVIGNKIVDLGLSVKWAESNLSSWDYDNIFYAWGETETKDSYTWKNYLYANGTSSSCVYLSDNISGISAYDAATNDIDYYDEEIDERRSVRMPTAQEFQELLDKCTFEIDYQECQDVFQKGYRVTGPNGNSIFMPFIGCSYDGKEYGKDTYAYYWTSNNDPKYKYKSKAAYLSENEKIITSVQRRTGIAIRPVADNIRYVDLGLPSGNLWAKTNLGYDDPYSNGRYYAWGETSEKTDYTWKNYMWANGTASSVKNIGDCISNFGDFYYDEDCEDMTPGSCWSFIWFDPCVEAVEDLHIFDDFSEKEITYCGMMPTKDDFEELLANCTIKEETKLVASTIGVKGLSFIGPNGSSIFFPYAHSCYDGKGPTSGTSSYYWTGDLSSDKKKAYALSVNNGSAAIATCQRRTGLPIRPVYVRMDYEEANASKFEADGIRNLKHHPNVEKDATYTLQGIKVEGNLKPGVYIRNGKKFVVK